MNRQPIVAVVLCLAGAAAAIVTTRSQIQPADLILSNGKVVTVDDRFQVASAVAIRGERIVAVGSDRDVVSLAGSGTRRIDLAGRTVIPGLIDNHMHLLRAGTTWLYEVRLDGVESRKAAQDLLRARAATTPRGEWVYTLGGWTMEQFADDKTPFTRVELDRAVPDHPVFLQASYYNGYLNTRGMQSLGVDAPDGVVDERGMRAAAARMPTASGERLEASTRQMLRDFNRMGITAFGSAGCEDDVLPLYRRLASRGELDMRVFCITAALQPPRGDHYIDHVAYGESVYGPLHDPMFVAKSDPSPAALAEWRRIATGVVQARRQLHVHANLTGTIDAFLDQIDIIKKQHSIDDLRWTLAHVNQINATHLARMKVMGVHAAVHPWTIINGGINLTVFGDAAYDMPPLRTIQESGVVWGFGSDGSRANQIRPFTTLGWAVTGKMVGGTKLLRQTISREQALVAHTRSNAYLLFRERDLGSIEAGKLADLAVLDRDYLTVPADEIKAITSLMTIVGGRIVHQSKESGIGNQESGPAQSPEPGFDVVSIKRNVSGAFPVGPEARRGGSFVAINATLERIVRFAYDLPEYRVVGGPDWVRSARFDIEARAARDFTANQIKLIVQAMLKDRFQVVSRQEQREGAVYALLMARDDKRRGPNLRPAAAGCDAPTGSGETDEQRLTPNGGVSTRRTCTKMAALVESLSNALQAPVDDKTALAGLWDYELTYTGQRRRGASPAAVAQDPNEAPVLVTAVQEQLGLKLDAGRGAVDVLVIESAAQPADN